VPIPRKPSEKKPLANERDIDALISRGGSVAVQAAPANRKPMKQLNLLQLRLSGELLQKIDETIERRHPHKETRPPRHAWFIEAFLEKLERENQDA